MMIDLPITRHGKVEMNPVVSWLAFGTSVVALLAPWTTILLARREARKAREEVAEEKRQRRSMADHYRRLADAAERIALNYNEPETLARQFENKTVTAPALDVEWIIEPTSPIKWALRNLGPGTAHNLRIDETRIDVETLKVGDSSSVPPLSSIELEIVAKWGMSIPAELWIMWDEQPDPIAVKMPHWY